VRFEPMRVSREWYVTAAHGRAVRSDHEVRWIPSSPTHLKQMGEQETACGVTTINWNVFWLELPTDFPDICPSCHEVLRTSPYPRQQADRRLHSRDRRPTDQR
jgi:hypothetical protein